MVPLQTISLLSPAGDLRRAGEKRGQVIAEAGDARPVILGVRARPGRRGAGERRYVGVAVGGVVLPDGGIVLTGGTILADRLARRGRPGGGGALGLGAAAGGAPRLCPGGPVSRG